MGNDTLRKHRITPKIYLWENIFTYTKKKTKETQLIKLLTLEGVFYKIQVQNSGKLYEGTSEVLLNFHEFSKGIFLSRSSNQMPKKCTADVSGICYVLISVK